MKNLLLMALSLTALVQIGCGQQLAKDTPGKTNTNSISLERQFQRVVRYDCAKKVVSDGIETVKSPTKLVQVSPTDPRTVSSSTFVNSRNGTTAGLIINNTQFTVDYSYGALNMRVDPGINVVNYKFFSGVGVVQEEGTVTLDVSYKETTLPGTLEKDDCPPPPTTQNNK